MLYLDQEYFSIREVKLNHIHHFILTNRVPQNFVAYSILETKWTKIRARWVHRGVSRPHLGPHQPTPGPNATQPWKEAHLNSSWTIGSKLDQFVWTRWASHQSRDAPHPCKQALSWAPHLAIGFYTQRMTHTKNKPKQSLEGVWRPSPKAIDVPPNISNWNHLQKCIHSCKGWCNESEGQVTSSRSTDLAPPPNIPPQNTNTLTLYITIDSYDGATSEERKKNKEIRKL